ncbi:hypothetical protein K5V21_00050 [Clostridium sardiniense]|uniref:Uncharacterized protein n=1 Tax=Clostridium sardiniense TaxID=29369 RepID=A0ABS7KSP1_CLOSR|nr:hypothetical protein [Clostridium sardiniense]MBY0753833.1 hypothetical protein [Clostridium sardiniense]MDQ0459653.1 hypothetical protein [Clostridium sardiniense]
MRLDLYTIYLYNYSKEYLFQKNVDFKKISEFSKSSKAVFRDDFIFEKIVATNVIEFYEYLKKRKCFKVGLLIHNKKELFIKFWCKFSLEYWHGEYITKSEIDCSYMEYRKVKEELWADKYMELTKKEKDELRLRFKINNYIDD